MPILPVTAAALVNGEQPSLVAGAGRVGRVECRRTMSLVDAVVVIGWAAQLALPRDTDLGDGRQGS